MKRNFLLAALLPLSILLALAGCARVSSGADRVKDFAALDMPYDDGAGVMLKWRPLDKSHRVIQYNIYRGCTPDSLFLLSRIEVDPKLGVASPWLNFYDKDFIPIFEFETAPAKLTKEKQQSSQGTLYKSVPRDPAVIGRLLPHYTVLGDISSARYYKSSRRVELKTKGQKEVYAGYRLAQFNNLYANPKAEYTYYYCVVPVTETGRFLTASPVLSATPVNNRPDSTAVLNTVYLRDKNEFRFEWIPPLGSTDISAWQAWLMPKSSLPQFYQDQKANAAAPDTVFNANWQKDAVLLHEMYPSYWSQVFYDKTDFAKSPVQLPPLERLSDYIPVISYQDQWTSEDGARTQNCQTAAVGEPLRIADSSQLPKLPDYTVLDKPNDKGDNIIISFGKPLAFVTLANYTNRAKTRLRINYEISGNGIAEIEKIRFRFWDARGKKLLGEKLESYPDKTIHFALPKGTPPAQNLTAQIYLKLAGEKEFSPEPVIQSIEYDTKSLRFNGGGVRYRGQLLNDIYYDIFTRSQLSSAFSPGMRIGALSRSYDQSVPFPSSENPQILKYDPSSRLLLTDHHFLAAWDNRNQVDFSPSFYPEDFAQTIKELRQEIRELKKNQIPGDSLGVEALTYKGKRNALRFILANPGYRQALKAKNSRQWIKALRAELDRNGRSYAHTLLATDGKGLWSDERDFGAPAVTNAGESEPSFLYPRGEWFDKTKLATLIASLIMGVMVVYALVMTRRKDLYIRPIAGLQELDNAVGRATEMGRPVMFVPGWGTLGEPCTISAMMILNQIAKKTAEYDIRLISPHVDYFVVPLAQEMVQTAYSEVGRPDAYDPNEIFFVSDTQFAFCAAVNGLTVRERVATIFYMGYFYAEALLMTETGNQNGAIQIAASDAITQIPFFITTCDYTLIGEEFYAASAYLSRNVELVSMLKAQDYFKILIVIAVLIGVVLSTMQNNVLLNFLPFE